MSKTEPEFRQQKLDDMVQMVRSMSNSELIDRYAYICRKIGGAEYHMDLETMNDMLKDSGIYGEELHRRLSVVKNRLRLR